MHLQVRFVSSDKMEASVESIQEIFRRHLSRFQHRFKQVQLYIEDVNGPRGGIDKHCRCVLHLRRRPPIVISDSDERVLPMIHRVADRIRHTLSRSLERKRSRSDKRDSLDFGQPPTI